MCCNCGTAHCVIDVGGIGFKLAMSTGSLAALPHIGDTVTVHTYLLVRPEELALFGFESESERELFERLITVSGVGPKVALAALSTWSPPEMIEAIVTEDTAAITSIPGVGKKTAQRIILDLKDALGAPPTGARVPLGSAGAVAETRDALLTMGFSSAEVASVLGGVDSKMSSAELLKMALKRLGGGA